MSPKMIPLVKLFDEFPSKAPIREHKTSEIDVREVDADRLPLSTDTHNPLSLASNCIVSRKSRVRFGYKNENPERKETKKTIPPWIYTIPEAFFRPRLSCCDFHSRVRWFRDV